MSRDPGGIRNIERIEEQDDERRMPRGVTIAFVVLGGACVVFAALALGGRTSRIPEKKTDPLGDLLAQRSRGAATMSTATSAPPTELSPRDVTFPQMLSDNAHPSTALAAVRTAVSAESSPTPTTTPAPPAATQPPPPTDRLSVVDTRAVISSR
jgi:DedD protein